MSRRAVAPALVDLLGEEIDKQLSARFAALERQIHGVAADVGSVAKQTAFLLQKAGVKIEGDERDEGPIRQVDQTWQCRKCGALLGFYDEADDELRIRHKDFSVWIHVGLGGSVSVPCRSCSELNTVRNESGPGEQTG